MIARMIAEVFIIMAFAVALSLHLELGSSNLTYKPSSYGLKVLPGFADLACENQQLLSEEAR